MCVNNIIKTSGSHCAIVCLTLRAIFFGKRLAIVRICGLPCVVSVKMKLKNRHGFFRCCLC